MHGRNRKLRKESKPETFDFLGFTHYCSKGIGGIFRVKRKTSKKKFRAKVQEMKEWLRKRMHCKVSETIKQINIKLLEHYRYYGITDNTKSIKSFYEITAKMLYKTLNRRTQKNKYSYQEYYEKIQKQIIRPKNICRYSKNGICYVKRRLQRAVCVSSASTVL